MSESGDLEQEPENSLMNALRTKNGTVAGPITLICATVCFLGILACFVLLFVFRPQQADIYIRALIPVLASVGAAAVIWFKAHSIQTQNTNENLAINANVVTATAKAANASDKAATIAHELNSGLDAKVEAAVLHALSVFTSTGVVSPAVEKTAVSSNHELEKVAEHG